MAVAEAFSGRSGGLRLFRLAGLCVLLGISRTQAQIALVDPEARTPEAETQTGVGLDEKVGQSIPLDLVFTDEQGVPRSLRSCLDRPTILVLAFYHCPGACGMIQSSVAGAVASIPFTLGKDYRVLSISFDEEETAALAAETRSNYTASVQGGVAEDAWRFMTGDLTNIQRLCTAVGFRAKKLGHHSYVHPNLITVLSGDGKIIRYLYGTSFLPLDVGMALSEASRGTPGVSIKKIMSYCYNYDPHSRRYTFNVFRVFGVTTLLVAGLFLFFLLRKRGGTPPKPSGS
jgi:protein SCO1/2